MTTAAAQLEEMNEAHASMYDADAPTIAVRVQALVKTYKDGTQANRGIDLEVRRGEIIAVLGPNGAGKTTFLRQLTTELRPTSGTIEIFNVDAVRESQRAKRMMGITPQDAGLFETLTVREHFELFARFKDLNKREAQAAAREVIADLELDESGEKRVGLLSGGQTRRVLIGLALLGKPPLLVLDEPTTGLDPASRHAVWRVLRRRVSEGATLILSTHYMEEAERLSDRVAIFSAGHLVAFDSLEKLHGRLDRSHRLCFRDPFDSFGAPRVRLFTTFSEAQAFVARERLSEYTLARASLEDVYFALTGERFEESETAKREA